MFTYDKYYDKVYSAKSKILKYYLNLRYFLIDESFEYIKDNYTKEDLIETRFDRIYKRCPKDNSSKIFLIKKLMSYYKISLKYTNVL